MAVAVRDPSDAAHLYRDILGAQFLMGADEEEQAFRFVQYRFPQGGKVELVSPLGEGFLTRFLKQRGEGVHHITFKVPNLVAQVASLHEAGIEPTAVSLDDPAWREAFIHPRDAQGVLIQLAESGSDDDEAARHFAVRFPEAVLLAERPARSRQA